MGRGKGLSGVEGGQVRKKGKESYVEIHYTHAEGATMKVTVMNS